MKKALPFATTWMDYENIGLSEIRERQRKTNTGRSQIYVKYIFKKFIEK